MRDGVVIAAPREERLSHVKRDSSLPHQAIKPRLDTIGASLSDVDAVALLDNPALHAATPNRRMSGSLHHHFRVVRR